MFKNCVLIFFIAFIIRNTNESALDLCMTECGEELIEKNGWINEKNFKVEKKPENVYLQFKQI